MHQMFFGSKKTLRLPARQVILLAVFLTKIQYSYINKRIISNKVINHAIYQAYCDSDILSATEHPSFVILLDIGPNEVNINVHPIKKRGVFYKSRLVYDFIYQAIITVIKHSCRPILIGKDKLGTVHKNRFVSVCNYFLPKNDKKRIY